MASSDDNVFANDSAYHWEMRRKASFSKLTGAVPRTIPGMYNEDEDPHADAKKEKLWKLMETYLSSDIHSIQRSVVNHVEYTCAKTRFNCDPEACYRAAAFSVRDRLIETLNDTNSFFHEKDCKRGYYLSLEFLLGRGMNTHYVWRYCLPPPTSSYVNTCSCAERGDENTHAEQPRVLSSKCEVPKITGLIASKLLKHK